MIDKELRMIKLSYRVYCPNCNLCVSEKVELPPINIKFYSCPRCKETNYVSVDVLEQSISVGLEEANDIYFLEAYDLVFIKGKYMRFTSSEWYRRENDMWKLETVDEIQLEEIFQKFIKTA